MVLPRRHTVPRTQDELAVVAIAGPSPVGGIPSAVRAAMRAVAATKTLDRGADSGLAAEVRDRIEIRSGGAVFENTRSDTGKTFLSVNLDFSVALTELITFLFSPRDGDQPPIDDYWRERLPGRPSPWRATPALAGGLSGRSRRRIRAGLPRP